MVTIYKPIQSKIINKDIHSYGSEDSRKGHTHRKFFSKNHTLKHRTKKVNCNIVSV